jgi:predicted PurR-regulated permease PerM
MIYDEVKYADKVFSGFLRGKVLDSTIVGMICFIAMSIMGVEDAVLISVIVGVTNIIPFFGPFIGAVPSALLIFVHDPKQCLYFVIFIVILQQFDGNILGPKCMGNTTNLSAFWILFSILVFGGMFGFIGMIIGVPLFAVIYDISKKLIYHSLKKHGKEELIAPISSENAEPPAEAEPEPETKNIPAENAEE